MQSLNAKKIGDNIIGNVRLGPEMNALFLSLRGVVREIDVSGKPISMFGVLRDVTDEVRLTEERIKAELRESELRHLRASLNPHFLFNSLNVLKSLIIEDVTMAQQAVISLAKILRSSLKTTRQPQVPLREELEVVRAYIDLQKLRYENRLDISLVVDQAAESFLLPPMLLHQLLENAIKHGMEKKLSSQGIQIHAFLEEENLVLITTNPGIYDAGADEGIGLQSIRKQLNSLYGASASFEIANAELGLVRARIKIPPRAIVEEPFVKGKKKQ
jgi:hypothetical protein